VTLPRAARCLVERLVDRRLCGGARRAADGFPPHSLQLGPWDARAGQEAIEQRLMQRVSELDHDVVERARRPFVQEQLLEEDMLLLDPVSLAEGNKRRALERRKEPIERGDGCGFP
jgi:hypothetical protein